MRMVSRTLLISGFGVFVLGACSSAPKPILMPNKKYERVGKTVAERDTRMCLSKADSHLADGRSERKKKAALNGAGTGAVIGGVAGLISPSQSVVGSAIGGAAVGGIAGYALGGDAPAEARQKIVNACLEQKGYKVAGWD